MGKVGYPGYVHHQMSVVTTLAGIQSTEVYRWTLGSYRRW